MRKKKSIILTGLLVMGGVLGLSACQTTTGCSASSTKCFSEPNTLLNKVITKTEGSKPQLNPQFNYIRLVMNGQPLWLAQGATTRWPTKNTKVFYSADRSVFKWANGRLIAVTTPSIYWRENIESPIDWSTVKPFTFNREVDTKNGITALREQRTVDVTSIPKHHSYKGDDTDLIWVHEYSIASSEVAQAYPSFDHWYAFTPQNPNEPVYGQQCISKQNCLSWQVGATL